MRQIFDSSYCGQGFKFRSLRFAFAIDISYHTDLTIKLSVRVNYDTFCQVQYICSCPPFIHHGSVTPGTPFIIATDKISNVNTSEPSRRESRCYTVTRTQLVPSFRSSKGGSLSECRSRPIFATLQLYLGLSLPRGCCSRS